MSSLRGMFVLIFAALSMLWIYGLISDAPSSAWPSFTSIPVKTPDNSANVKRTTTAVLSSISAKSKSTDRQGLLLDYCPLHNLDPWDTKVRSFLNPTLDPLRNCTSKIDQLTELIHGRVVIKDRANVTDCAYRCLTSFGDYNLQYGLWTLLANNSIPPCDVIEVQCYDAKVTFANGTRNFAASKPIYEYLHAQVFRPSPATPDASTPPPQTAPNVFLIILDSVSMSQFFRCMPKTAFFLREELEAIPFRHLNKAGYNSRPNGFALLTGKQIDKIPRSLVSVGHNPDFPSKTDCHKFLNNEHTIMHRFKKAGFVTAYIEDIYMPIFAYPYCKGLRKPAADHQTIPFFLRVDVGSKHMKAKLNENILNKTCHEYHHVNMAYLQSFIDNYPDKPKFAATWMVNLAHNDHNSLFHADDFFYQFFRRNREVMRNSFVWVLADHGPRFLYDVRANEVFSEEGYNPAMFFSVPDKLKSDKQLMDVIRENSKKLITHYDNFATMIDILSTLNSSLPTPLLHGNSILKPLPEPRTCDRLRIPIQFCSCNFNRTRLPKSDPLNHKAALLFVDRMNKVLDSSKRSVRLCSRLSLNSTAPIVTDMLDDQDGFQFYEIRFKTTPGNGEYSGFFSRRITDDNLTIESSRFLRHGKKPSCAGVDMYCHCK